LPPVLVRRISQVRSAGNPFDGDFASWQEARLKCDGYDSSGILDKVLAATLKVKRGEAEYERDSVIFDHIEYCWPVTAGLMWAAARNNGRLNVLDFGGSLGSSYFQNRKFLQLLPHLSWNVVEQSHYVDAGQQHIQSDELQFYRSIDECVAVNQPNVVLLSSVLQYLDDPEEIAGRLSAIGATCMIIDKTPFSNLDVDKILVQKVPASIYSASYPMRVFSRAKFLQQITSNWNLLELFTNSEQEVTSSSGCKFSFQGMLLDFRQ